MQTKLQLTWRDMDPDPKAEELIREYAGKLEKSSLELIACKVMVEVPHKHHQGHGNLYHVRVDLTVPGQEIVADRHPDAHADHEELSTAVHDAFRAAERQMRQYAGRMRTAHREPKSL